MRLCLVLGILILGTVLLAPTASAEPRLGRAWETPIEEGIAKQELERKDRRPEAILRQAELLAARRSQGAVKIARLYLLARAYGIAGDGASAKGAYREVLGLARDCYFAYHDLAMLAMAQKPADTKLSERYLRQAVQVHPRYTTGYRKLARLLIGDGDRRDEALIMLQRVIELAPGDLEARHLRARGLIAARRYPEAEKEIVALLRKEPRNPLYRDLKAAYYLETGKIDRAMQAYRDLVEEMPSVPAPLQGYMACLAKLKEQGTVDPEQWLWGLERLMRLTSDPEEKKRLREGIEEFRKFKGGVPAVPDQPKGPPTDEQISKLIVTLPEAEHRAELLAWVYTREKPPEDALVKAVLGRLSAKSEPSPKVRQWALRVLGRFGGLGMVRLVRLTLADPDREVRSATVDTLVDLSVTDDAALGGAILILGLYTENVDRALAAAARATIRDLAKAQLPEPTADTEAARLQAFLTWWRGPVASDAKIRALATFSHLQDLYPEDVLLPYMKDSHDFVVDAAWQSMIGIAKQRIAADDAEIAQARRENRAPRGVMPADRRSWFQRIPAHREGVMRTGGAAAARASLARWAAEKPR